MAKKRTLSALHIGIYLVALFAVWSVKELIIRPVFLDNLDDTICQIVEPTMKMLLWALPALLLIRYYQDDMQTSLKDMLTTRPRLALSALMTMLLVLTALVNVRAALGELRIRPESISVELIDVVVVAGFAEEIVFRGFLLNATLKRMKLWPAMILNGALFALIHYPIWINSGFGIAAILSSTPGIMILGVFFSYAFANTGSIFVPILLHMIWNSIISVF